MQDHNVQDDSHPEAEDADDLEQDKTFDDLQPPPRARRSDSQLEEAYDSQTFRIVTQRNDFLVPALIQSIKDRQYINLTPPYQRRTRWDAVRKSRLIESLLMNVPIPPVFLFETNLAQYEVVDGQQRLSTLRQFFDNEFALTGLEKWPDLNGRRYNKLPSRIQAGLQRRSLAAIILLAESGRSDVADTAAAQRDLKRIVFARLNTGGVRLNPQEIRNAAFESPFNDLLHTLSRDDLFATIWAIPARTADEEIRPSPDLANNILFKTMRDCDIVLRFFAFRNEGRMSSSVKKTLDEAMNRGAEASPPEIERMRADYLDCLRTAHDLYADRTFRLPNGTLSRALYDAIMVGLDRLMRDLAPNDRLDLCRRLSQARHGIQESHQRLFKDVNSQELLVGRLNTRQSIIDRIHLMEELFRRHS